MLAIVAVAAETGESRYWPLQGCRLQSGHVLPSRPWRGDLSSISGRVHMAYPSLSPFLRGQYGAQSQFHDPRLHQIAQFVHGFSSQIDRTKPYDGDLGSKRT